MHVIEQLSISIGLSYSKVADFKNLGGLFIDANVGLGCQKCETSEGLLLLTKRSYLSYCSGSCNLIEKYKLHPHSLTFALKPITVLGTHSQLPNQPEHWGSSGPFDKQIMESSPPWKLIIQESNSTRKIWRKNCSWTREGTGCWFVWEAQTLKKASRKHWTRFLVPSIFSMMNVIKCTDYKGARVETPFIAFAAFPELNTTISRMTKVVKANLWSQKIKWRCGTCANL